jgi:hypothetical protein
VSIAAALVVGGCGDDNGDAKREEPPQTQPEVLGGQIAAGKLALFCQTGRDLRATLRASPLDGDALSDLLGAYLTSAPDQIQPQVKNVVAVFTYHKAVPTLAQDRRAIRSFKANNCPPA